MLQMNHFNINILMIFSDSMKYRISDKINKLILGWLYE